VKRDSQRQKSYRAEDFMKFPTSKDCRQLTQDEFVALVHRVWKDSGRLGLPTVKFKLTNRGRWGATADSDGMVITVYYADKCDVRVALHETAHLLTPDDPGHGPEWRAVYAGLLDAYLRDGAGREFLRAFDRLNTKPRYNIMELVGVSYREVTHTRLREVIPDLSDRSRLCRLMYRGLGIYVWRDGQRHEFKMVQRQPRLMAQSLAADGVK
jgi:hypothetical protein